MTRGMRTLDLRVRAAAANAMELALSASPITPRWRRCSIPACRSHPGHDVARRQMQGGFGGMLSIRVRGGADGRGRRGGAGRGVEARHLARRRRIADRAPRLDRRPGLALPARPLAALRRNRGRRRPVARPRPGAARIGLFGAPFQKVRRPRLGAPRSESCSVRPSCNLCVLRLYCFHRQKHEDYTKITSAATFVAPRRRAPTTRRWPPCRSGC